MRVADGGVAALAEDPAAGVSSRIALDRAATDGGVAVPAGDPAAATTQVVHDRAAADGGAAAVAVDPAAVVSGESLRNNQVLDYGSFTFTRVDHEHVAHLAGHRWSHPDCHWHYQW